MFWITAAPCLGGALHGGHLGTPIGWRTTEPQSGVSGGGVTLWMMPLGPLGVTAALAALDWGAWDWATNSNQTTVGLIAGLLMAPIAVAFAWSLARVVVAFARIAVQRLSAESRLRRPDVRPIGVPFDREAENDRVAA